MQELLEWIRYILSAIFVIQMWYVLKTTFKVIKKILKQRRLKDEHNNN